MSGGYIVGISGMPCAHHGVAGWKIQGQGWLFAGRTGCKVVAGPCVSDR